VNIYFTDYFKIDPEVLEEYGALNISLINDLPLFIDPFLLFNSNKQEYCQLHNDMIEYLRFLRNSATERNLDEGLIQRWFRFPEVKQNWLGYSRKGNTGTGLGNDFANSLHSNLQTIFSSFGNEQLTKGSHLEKLCLISPGVGRDNISDFTTNLIKSFLLEYTQAFTLEFIDPRWHRKYAIDRVSFNYDTESWMREIYTLPTLNNDYIILTPKDILRKNDTWISRGDMLSKYHDIVDALPDIQLRSQLNHHFEKQLTKDATKEEKEKAWSEMFRMHPELIDHYIRLQEDNGEDAVIQSNTLVFETEEQLITNVKDFVNDYLVCPRLPSTSP